MTIDLIPIFKPPDSKNGTLFGIKEKKYSGLGTNIRISFKLLFLI
ncbi:hypothetical protein LEP1GSC073_1747 [Leptospira noguchii str. Cascata]|nr:hypothetical protein LEP1GSC073_1747 [Leptospira noguchii str. Cascata]